MSTCRNSIITAWIHGINKSLHEKEDESLTTTTVRVKGHVGCGPVDGNTAPYPPLPGLLPLHLHWNKKGRTNERILSHPRSCLGVDFQPFKMVKFETILSIFSSLFWCFLLNLSHAFHPFLQYLDISFSMPWTYREETTIS